MCERSYEQSCRLLSCVCICFGSSSSSSCVVVVPCAVKRGKGIKSIKKKSKNKSSGRRRTGGRQSLGGVNRIVDGNQHPHTHRRRRRRKVRVFSLATRRRRSGERGKARWKARLTIRGPGDNAKNQTRTGMFCWSTRGGLEDDDDGGRRNRG